MLPVPFSWLSVYLCILAFYAEDRVLQKFGMPSAPEVFSYAWLVLLLPFMGCLWGRSSMTPGVVACMIGYALLVVAANNFGKMKFTKKVEARTQSVDSMVTDGATPLLIEDQA